MKTKKKIKHWYEFDWWQEAIAYLHTEEELERDIDPNFDDEICFIAMESC